MKSKKELQKELSLALQRSGTLTVLHTNAVAVKIGLSATEFEALDIIQNRQPITAGQLATYCGLTTGAITGLVDRLQRGKFVRRIRDDKDRRKVFIKPVEDTEKSKRVYQLYGPMIEEYRTVVEKYSPEELELLVKMNNELSDAAERSIARLHGL
jgi:DNA-binding MarR family transcriptional regulator